MLSLDLQTIFFEENADTQKKLFGINTNKIGIPNNIQSVIKKTSMISVYIYIQGVSRKRYFRRKGLLFCGKRRTQEIEEKMVWFGSKVYTMEVDRREKSVEQSTNAVLNPSARSENTFFVNCSVSNMTPQRVTRRGGATKLVCSISQCYANILYLTVKKLFVLVFTHLVALFSLFMLYLQNSVIKYTKSAFLYINIVKIKTTKKYRLAVQRTLCSHSIYLYIMPILANLRQNRFLSYIIYIYIIYFQLVVRKPEKLCSTQGSQSPSSSLRWR